MPFSLSTLLLLGGVAFSGFTCAQTIAYGQEYDASQINHWVAWIDGSSACPPQHIFGDLTTSICDQPFNLGEVQYTFSGCSGTGAAANPAYILDSAGLQVGACNTVDQNQIDCSPPTHDVIRHGVCEVQNGASRKFKLL